MTLGDRMKEYEMQSRTRLLRRTPVIIRLDGRAFHTLTRGLDKPFDRDFMDIMQRVTLSLCEQIQGCVLGYTQSDEITLVLIDYQKIESMAWFDNQVQKICSVAASIATAEFNKELHRQILDLQVEAHYSTFMNIDNYSELNKKADLLLEKLWRGTFDARAFNLPQHEVINNLIWRQQDATRNSILAVAQSLYSHKEIQNIGTKELQNKMLIEKNVNWNNFRTDEKRGVAIIKDNEGKWFIDMLTPIFTEDRDYINRLIYPDSNDE